MKSILRRKNLSDNLPDPPPHPPIQHTRPPAPIETPLYARFASFKQEAQAPEKIRPIVSGPMPLGQYSRPNPAAVDHRKTREEATPRHRASNGPQETPLVPQSLYNSLPHTREAQSSLDRPYQDTRVNLIQAAKLPTAVRRTPLSPEQLATSKTHRAPPAESVRYLHDVLPSPPASPPPTSYSREVTPTTVNQPPPSTFLSVVKSNATETGISAIPSSLYEKPRQPISRSSGNLPRTSEALYHTTKSDSKEPEPHKPNDRFLAAETPQPPNQASRDIVQLQGNSASYHQGVAWTLQSNGHSNKLPSGVIPNGPNGQTSRETFDPKLSQQLTGGPSLRTTAAPPHPSVSETLVTKSTSAPVIDTPFQSSVKHANTTRLATTLTPGQPRIFSTRNSEPKPAPEPTQRGPLIFTAQDSDSRHINQRKSSHDVGQRGHQQLQGLAKPLPSTTITETPAQGSHFASHRSFSHPLPHNHEQVKTFEAAASYGDEPPPKAHPAMRTLSRSFAARMHAPQTSLEDQKRSFIEHSRKSSHGNRPPKEPTSSIGLSSYPSPEREDAHSSSQARLDGDPLVPSSPPPVPEQDILPPTPPTPPLKSPLRDARSNWSHHMKRQSSSSQPLPPTSTDDVEIETRPDLRKSWAILVSSEPQLYEDDLSSPDVRDSREDVQDTRLLDDLSVQESPNGATSSGDGDSLQAPAAVGQLQDGSYDSVVNPSDLLEDDSVELVASDPQCPQNDTQQPLEDDSPLALKPSVGADLRDARLVARPRPRSLPAPCSPEEYSRARARRRGTWLETSVPADIAELAEETKPTFYPLLRHLQIPELLTEILAYLSFYEWLILWGGVSKEIRQALDTDPALSDVALERYLGTVGYARWSWPSRESIRITLAEMHAYMRGVSVPVHVYAQFAFSTLISPPSEDNARLVNRMKKETRAFNRIVIRLRAQAEADVEQVAALRRRQSNGQSQSQRQHNGPPLSWSAGAAQGQGGKHRSVSRQSSRAPSPTNSAWSQAASSQAHLPLGTSPPSGGFRSPLFRLRRAPLLRVFVPSPEGDWLSDASVLECETELRKAGILPLLRVGDVIWDIALGDEGNVGRLVWDGRYLIDLDYTFSHIGDVPPSVLALAFPPSYFHRVIRVAGDRNPIAHLDIRFWGEEIITNLQLLQDRVRTETPQGTYHTVVRWVHRSSFTIHAPPGSAPVITLPNRERRVVDPSWRGTVVIEAEGTNEGLSDLHARCRGQYQPRAGDIAPAPGERERMVWRVLRERSRPGEIWLRAVSHKERLIL